MDKIYKTIDLFAGIGGIRKGYENTGRFKNVLSAEIDKYACESYKFLYGDDPYNDVESEAFKKLVESTEYDVLLGGFPCQAFSIAGLKEGFEDETRGTLFFDIAKIIDMSKPKAFMLENVEGLLKHDKGNTFNVIARTLDELGYIVVGVDIEETLVGKKYSAKRENIVRTPYDFGIPQRRARVFIMGFRKDIVPKGYIFPMLPTGRELNIYKDLNDLIEEVVEPKYYLSQTYLDTLNRHKDRHKLNKSGFGYIVVNDESNPIANTIMATGGSGKERNLIRQYKEDYIGLKNIGAKKGELNKEGIRYMTPREWGKLQGFVNYAFMENGIDKFELPKSISNTQQYKLFGNSVCIPVIESMAEYMVERLDEFYGRGETKMGFNKGEWSELYAIFYLLANRKLNLVDCKLNLICSNIFSVESIISKKKSGVIKFDIQNDIVIPEIFGEKIEPIKIEEIIKFKNQLFNNIISGSDGSGAFEIDYVNQWLEKHNILTNFKAKSGVKEDIFLLNLDLNRNKKIELGYSIKSQLGSPATILNASDHTNIRYTIDGLDDEQINEINSINTKNKLKDRILKIYEYGGKILFDKVVSECFDRNLRMVDTALPEALAEVLLKSYSGGSKELKELFKTSSIYTSESLTYKKLEDFLMAVSFGMFPAKEWDGKFTVNGGLIIVAKNSEVYVIDMVYYEDDVKKFLINETKLDSPSSSRYDMLRLRKENEKIYFTLNLQVRYKN